MVTFIPTPIGNLQDITFRAIEKLQEAELFLCEDTRVTKQLLKLIDEKVTPLEILETAKFLSFNEHNGKERLEEIGSLLESKSVVYLSDAGMPSISDPGMELVNYCIENSIEYDVLAGATALATAYSASGFDGKFIFWGFLPHKTTKREQDLNRVLEFGLDTILYEAPHRLLKLLKEINQIDPKRELFLAKELTKKHQKYYRDSAKILLQKFKDINIRGEWVVIIRAKEQNSLSISYSEILQMEIPPKVKAKILSKITDLSTKEWYSRLVNSHY